jgi:transcription-repair coupling factor (superfamily II helicase)
MQLNPQHYFLSNFSEAACSIVLRHYLPTSTWPTIVQISESDQTLLSEQIALFSQCLFHESLPVLIFPDDTLDLDARGQINRHQSALRMQCLQALINRQSCVILTTLQGLEQKTHPPFICQQLQFRLSVGKAIHLPDLKNFLLETQFIEQDPVLQVGTYILRAEVLDIVLASGQAFRVHFFDDRVESIHCLDLQTQLTLSPDIQAPLDSLILYLAFEYFALSRFPKIASDLQAHFLTLLRTQKISPATREMILSLLESWIIVASSAPPTASNHVFQTDPVKRILFTQSPFQTFYKSIQESQAQPLILNLHLSQEPITDWNAWKSKRLTLGPFQIKAQDLYGQMPVDAPMAHFWNIRQTFEGTPVVDLGFTKLGPIQTPAQLEENLTQWTKKGFKIFIVLESDYQIKLIRHQTPQHLTVQYFESTLKNGFALETEGDKLIFVGNGELLFLQSQSTGKPRSSKRKKTDLQVRAFFESQDLQPGDYIVHKKHGIGCFEGIKRFEQDSLSSIDFVAIAYLGADKLYVPIYNLDLLQKYIGPTKHVPLNALGSEKFEKAKLAAQESATLLAIDLLKLYAHRKNIPGLRLTPLNPDEEPYAQFEKNFSFVETEDQLAAIHDVLNDLESGKVMDRLICGDVGFGKTEVAMRAAFRVAMEGYQVAVLVPTTILADQHWHTFKKRFEGTPIEIAALSRFQSVSEQKKILSQLKAGSMDIVIGTHRLLSQDVSFKNLGLLVLDEEQRFGVRHKEKLRALKKDVHCLTLSATPIPRTLQMSLSGLKDLSLIATPPQHRLAIRTVIAHDRLPTIERAIEFEIQRGGQVLFLCNAIETLQNLANTFQTRLPQVKTAIAHGQLPEKKLAHIMEEFYNGSIQMLLCTTIIESGIDVPRANTLLIKDAQNFGLTQLYQIRGRVGRSSQQAFCYLLIPENRQLTPVATERLNIIERFVALGSGFHIASHDLELRGAGDLLGGSQSGHSTQVGYQMYLEMIADATAEFQNSAKDHAPQKDLQDPEMRVPFPVFLPETYIPSSSMRLQVYRDLSAVTRLQDVDELEGSIKDRFGALPEATTNLFWLLRMKVLLKEHRATQFIASALMATVTFENKTKESFSWSQALSPDGLAEKKTPLPQKDQSKAPPKAPIHTLFFSLQDFLQKRGQEGPEG